MPLYQYYVVSYVTDINQDKGLVIDVFAISPKSPGFFAEKRLDDWTPVLAQDPNADCELLRKMLDELCSRIALNTELAREANRWENSLRISPGGEFQTSDFDGTFSPIAQAELGKVR